MILSKYIFTFKICFRYCKPYWSREMMLEDTYNFNFWSMRRKIFYSKNDISIVLLYSISLICIEKVKEINLNRLMGFFSNILLNTITYWVNWSDHTIITLLKSYAWKHARSTTTHMYMIFITCTVVSLLKVRFLKINPFSVHTQKPNCSWISASIHSEQL